MDRTPKGREPRVSQATLARSHSTPEVSAKQHPPRKKVFWFDPRFAIGLVLVVASVVGISALVAAADSGVTVLAARDTVVAGQRVDADDFVPTRVRIAGAQNLYIGEGDIPDTGRTATRTVAAGELVPASALGDTAAESVTSVVLDLGSGLPEAVVVGSRVDVWAGRELDNGDFEAPTVIVGSATVARVVDNQSLMASDSGTALELLIPRAATARVLEAVANGAAVSVVPVDLPTGN